MKTAPGTCMTVFGENGEVKERSFITLPEEDVQRGVSHEDNYVCSGGDYYEHMVKVFRRWKEYPEVQKRTVARHAGGMLPY